MREITILFICYFCSIPCDAQELTGTWTGNYEDANAVATSLRKLEVKITSQTGYKVKGYSYLEYDRGEHEKYAISGRYNAKDSTVYFVEEKELEITGGLSRFNVPGIYEMTLSTRNNVMRLEGRWEPDRPGTGHNFAIKPSVVWLEKSTSQEEEPVAKIVSVKQATPDDKNLARDIELQKIFEIGPTDKDKILLEFVDNQRIDNDRISVYVNKKRIISNQKVSKAPLSFNLSIPATDNNAMVIIAAESYGTVSPCTVLMRVSTNSEHYEVDLSSTFSTNAAVKFVVKK